MGQARKARAEALKRFECEVWAGKTERELIAGGVTDGELNWQEQLVKDPIYSRLTEIEQHEVALVIRKMAVSSADPLIQEIQRAVVYWNMHRCGGIHPFIALYLARRSRSYLPIATDPDVVLNEVAECVGYEVEEAFIPRALQRGEGFRRRAPLPTSPAGKRRPVIPGRKLRLPERDVAAWALRTIPTLPTEPMDTLSLREIAGLRTWRKSARRLSVSPARVDEAVRAVERLLSLALSAVKSRNRPG